jgi:hypothetical protein
MPFDMDVSAPPSVIVIEQPFNLGPPVFGVSPDSILAGPAFLPTGGGKHHAAQQQPPPQMPPDVASGPPMLAPVPPMLRRQNASRFAWPPDPMQEWTYIGLTPVELSEQCERVLSRVVSPLAVAKLFADNAGQSRAYDAYFDRHRHDIDSLLEQQQ